MITSGSTTTTTIPNLTAGTEYTVRVIATKTGADDGTPSAEEKGTPTGTITPPVPPGQVTGVTVTAGTLSLSVSWTRVTGATGYKVQYISGTQTFNNPVQVTVFGGATTSRTLSGLMAGTEYTVRVIATKSGADDGPPSAERTGTPTGTITPPVPEDDFKCSSSCRNSAFCTRRADGSNTCRTVFYRTVDEQDAKIDSMVSLLLELNGINRGFIGNTRRNLTINCGTETQLRGGYRTCTCSGAGCSQKWNGVIGGTGNQKFLRYAGNTGSLHRTTGPRQIYEPVERSHLNQKGNEF